jgi:hypothetical protein
MPFWDSASERAQRKLQVRAQLAQDERRRDQQRRAQHEGVEDEGVEDEGVGTPTSGTRAGLSA